MLNAKIKNSTLALTVHTHTHTRYSIELFKRKFHTWKMKTVQHPNVPLSTHSTKQRSRKHFYVCECTNYNCHQVYLKIFAQVIHYIFDILVVASVFFSLILLCFLTMSSLIKSKWQISIFWLFCFEESRSRNERERKCLCLQARLCGVLYSFNVSFLVFFIQKIRFLSPLPSLSPSFNKRMCLIVYVHFKHDNQYDVLIFQWYSVILQ